MSKKFNIKEWQKKHLLKEHTLGQLPSEKLMKMKWNPVKESEPVNEVSGFPIPGNIVKDIDKKHTMDAKLWKRATEDLINALTKDNNYTGTEIEGYLRGYVNLMTKNL